MMEEILAALASQDETQEKQNKQDNSMGELDALEYYESRMEEMYNSSKRIENSDRSGGNL